MGREVGEGMGRGGSDEWLGRVREDEEWVRWVFSPFFRWMDGSTWDC